MKIINLGFPYKQLPKDQIIELQEFFDSGGIMKFSIECGREADTHPNVKQYLEECEERLKKHIKDEYEKIHKQERRG